MSERTEHPDGAIPHAVVWGAAVLLYLGIHQVLLRVVALDFETLAVNLYYQDFAPPPWMPVGRVAILAGAAPLLVTCMARLGYRIAGRFTDVADPIADASAGRRTLLGFALGLPALLFVPATAAGMVVWLLAEGAWWVQWYHNQAMALYWLMAYGLPYLAGALAALVGVGLWWSVRVRGRRGTARRVAASVALVLAGIAALPLLGLGAVHGSRTVPPSGLGLFANRCGECHVRTRALFFVKTPDEWERTVTRMREFEGADLDEAQADRVLGFLTGMRSFSDAWTYRTRCERCHLPGGLLAGRDPRDPAEWAGIVEGFATTSPYYYRADVRAQIVRHLESNASEPGATLGLDADTYARFRSVGETCGLCHSLSRAADRYRSASIDEVEAMVARMSARMHEPLDEGEQIGAARDYQELIADPARFGRLYPHDRPVVRDPLQW